MAHINTISSLWTIVLSPKLLDTYSSTFMVSYGFHFMEDKADAFLVSSKHSVTNRDLGNVSKFMNF